jgi:hypothetical protein
LTIEFDVIAIPDDGYGPKKKLPFPTNLGISQNRWAISLGVTSEMAIQ